MDLEGSALPAGLTAASKRSHSGLPKGSGSEGSAEEGQQWRTPSPGRRRFTVLGMIASVVPVFKDGAACLLTRSIRTLKALQRLQVAGASLGVSLLSPLNSVSSTPTTSNLITSSQAAYVRLRGDWRRNAWSRRMNRCSSVDHAGQNAWDLNTSAGGLTPADHVRIALQGFLQLEDIGSRVDREVVGPVLESG